MKRCRKSIRLKMYDYTQEGAYAVTVCVNAHKCMFGCVRNSEMILNDLGNMIVDDWCKLPQRFSNIEMNEFIVMPDHMHKITIVRAGSPRPS